MRYNHFIVDSRVTGTLDLHIPPDIAIFIRDDVSHGTELVVSKSPERDIELVRIIPEDRPFPVIVGIGKNG
jgi:hypothetical protein